MLYPRLNELRRRLDALAEGRVHSARLVDRALSWFERIAVPGALVGLEQLDRDLDRAGIHTAADAKLLKQLGAMQGRVGELARGLSARGVQALTEYERALRRTERVVLARRLPPPGIGELERAFVRLSRIVKVADLFSSADTRSPDFELYAAPAVNRPAPLSARLAVVEFLSERARRTVDDLSRKRKDLEAAFELLLRLGGDADRDRARKLRVEVAAQRERVRAVPVVRSLEQLARHVRYAARREPSTAYTSLLSLYERAVQAGDEPVAKVAWRALDACLPASDALPRALERMEPAASLPLKSEDERSARMRAGATLADLADVAWGLDDDRLPHFQLAAGCARYFDVEGALSEEVVEAEVGAAGASVERVSYPTQSMTFDVTHRLDELPNFVISDPRSLVYDLASGRQLVRAYLDDRPSRRARRVRQSSVRVYVLDASGSMHGPRAQFRDAILMAELQNIRLKARRGLSFDPLYFSFFNDAASDLVRVDSPDEAFQQLEMLFQGAPAEGQTDIGLALGSAFEAIRSARGRDPYLARATVVLVTDGEDAVEVGLLRKSQSSVDAVEIALSVISLGEENPDLRKWVLEQRVRGGRAFYHHLSDAEVASAQTEFDAGRRTLLPPELVLTSVALDALTEHLDALEAIARARPVRAPRTSLEVFDARFPARALSEKVDVSPSERSRLRDILDAVAEAASLAPLEERSSEAVELLEHLLGLYGVSLPAYLRAIGSGRPELAEAVARVRLLARPFG